MINLAEKPQKMTMGGRIESKRKELGLSRERFADLVGVTVRFMFDIENDVKGMSLNTFFKICDILGVSADWLRNG